MWSLWNELLSDQDRQVITAAGYDAHGAASWDSRALGTRPALLVIDAQHLFVGADVPILEAINEHRTAMGHIAWRAIPHIAQLLAVARAQSVPVFFARVIPRGYAPTDAAVQIVAPLAPEAGEPVIDKSYSSVFFGTDLLARLLRAGVDTLILAGTATSGCIRATAVDACQLGLHPLIPVEAVFDRIEASHKIALLDLWMKYARLMPLEEVVAYLEETSTPVTRRQV